jgi:two-component system sensor histidine kinase ChvG
VFRELGRIRVRLLIVNLVVLVVPIFGLEFARLYERQLLGALERDMRDQCAVVREALEVDLDEGRPLDAPAHERMLIGAARTTRTRIRVLNEVGFVLVDSHRAGPPEGPEPPAPTILPDAVYSGPQAARRESGSITPDWARSSLPGESWPAIEQRQEVRAALGGHPDAYTRVRDRSPGVFLFVTEPVRSQGAVVGVVYATRSTRPVLAELYKIRTGLIRVLIVALVLTLILTLVLAWSISRPLSRLAKAARRIAGGERVKVPVGGGGEIRELGEAFATMTDKLDARMSYIREFAADVAHELKSPLTSIRGAAELLREGAADDPGARGRFLTNIELDAERLDRLVTRLLELSRIDSSQAAMQPFDVGSMIARVVDRTHSPEQPVEVEWRTPLRKFRGREEDIERAVTNLVENALRFSPEGQPVRVLIGAPHDGRELYIAVRDRGPGVPAAIRDKIFDRFFTTDADRNGTGLGLAIVESVARAHGGGVELESREGDGATFTMILRRGA